MRHETRRKNKENTNRTRTGEEENPAPVSSRGVEADLVLVAPPPPSCLHRENKFGFERDMQI
jgi:hypothetical protein